MPSLKLVKVNGELEIINKDLLFAMYVFALNLCLGYV